jgi:hypothetical protein
MPEQRRRIQPKVSSHPVDVIHVRRERHVLWPNVIRGSPTPPLIVVDEAEFILESIQLGQEIAVVEVWAAVKNDERLTTSDRSDMERRTADRDIEFARIRATLGLKRAR